MWYYIGYVPLWARLDNWEIEEFSKVIMVMQIPDSVKDLFAFGAGKNF